jgi:hypothetical protein
MGIEVHPSEFAYAFAFARAEAVIGWGRDPFQPEGPEDDWLEGGERRLTAAGRLVGNPESGLNFTEEMSSAILTLVNPGLVLLAQRKVGDGVKTMTVHIAGEDLVGLTRDADGMFDLTRYADLVAAAGACGGFVGASDVPLDREARIETDKDGLAEVRHLARDGKIAEAVRALAVLGAESADAHSAAISLAHPAAAGVVSALYCGNNGVDDVETFSVMTNAQDQTWIVFPPASLEGPMILERSSAAALTARIALGVAARQVR